MKSSGLEDFIENDIGDTGKDILDQIRISGRGFMRINRPCFQIDFTLAQKSVDDEIRRFLDLIRSALVGWKCHFDGFVLDFFLKKILFIEENDKGHLAEIGVVDDLLEEMKTVVHAIDAMILEQDLVVFRHGHHEQHAIHIIEAMDPYLAFRLLPANIKHVE